MIGIGSAVAFKTVGRLVLGMPWWLSAGAITFALIRFGNIELEAQLL